MRRLQAIALVVTLLLAPLAVLANAVSLARYEKQLRLAAQNDDCAHVSLGICGCEKGPLPVLSLVSPLPDMLLPRPVPFPALKIETPAFQALDLVAPSGFSPIAFHPPRG
jgi:hypothetical protein